MHNNKITFDEYLKTNAVIDEEPIQQDVFKDTPKKFDFTVFFLCVLTIACIGFTYYYYANSYLPANDKVSIEYVSSSSQSGDSSDITNEKININTADIDTLCKLNGIGQSKALAIAAHRTVNGNFKTIEELKEVEGIGDAIFKDIKDKICV